MCVAIKFYIFWTVLHIILITTISEGFIKGTVADGVYSENDVTKLTVNNNEIDLSRNEQMNQVKYKSFGRDYSNNLVPEIGVNDVLGVSLIYF